MGPGTGARIHQNAIRIALLQLIFHQNGIGMDNSMGTGMIVRFPLMPVARSWATSRNSHPTREIASF